MPARTAPRAGQVLAKDAPITLSQDAAPRSAVFVISDETPDRLGDVITAKGWQFDNFQKNPIVLFGHQARELPVGKVKRIWQDGTQTKAEVLFAGVDENPFAEKVFNSIKAGFLNASSVGFKPLADPEPIFAADKSLTGFKFIAQELLELSVVTVPALPTALIAQRAYEMLGLSEHDRKRIFVDPGRGALARHGAREREIQLMKMRAPC